MEEPFKQAVEILTNFVRMELQRWPLPERKAALLDLLYELQVDLDDTTEALERKERSQHERDNRQLGDNP